MTLAAESRGLTLSDPSQLPDGWTFVSLGKLVSVKNGADFKADEVADGGFPVFGSGGVFGRSSRYLFNGESVLFGRKGTIDRPLHVTGKFWTVDTMFYTVLGSRIIGRFLYYFATTVDFGYYATNTAVPSMTQRDIATFKVPLPSLEIQRQIADYLDAHTAKIDDLIGKQERLIETLAERRQAVISHAVTKGLDPNAPMKDSGVEWMGSIPSSWTVSRLRYMARILGGYSPEQVMPRESGPYPYFKVSDLNQADGNYSVAAAAEYTDQRALTAPTGTILFPKRGAAIFTNKVTVSTVRAVLDTNLMGLLVNDLIVNPLFLIHWLKSRTLNELADTSTLPQINNKHIYPLQIGLPSLKGQREITEYIDRETTQIDALSAKAREMIDVLKERRQALISAAVTGKIDVRGLA